MKNFAWKKIYFFIFLFFFLVFLFFVIWWIKLKIDLFQNMQAASWHEEAARIIFLNRASVYSEISNDLRFFYEKNTLLYSEINFFYTDLLSYSSDFINASAAYENNIFVCSDDLNKVISDFYGSTGSFRKLKLDYANTLAFDHYDTGKNVYMSFLSQHLNDNTFAMIFEKSSRIIEEGNLSIKEYAEFVERLVVYISFEMEYKPMDNSKSALYKDVYAQFSSSMPLENLVIDENLQLSHRNPVVDKMLKDPNAPEFLRRIKIPVARLEQQQLLLEEALKGLEAERNKLLHYKKIMDIFFEHLDNYQKSIKKN